MNKVILIPLLLFGLFLFNESQGAFIQKPILPCFSASQSNSKNLFNAILNPQTLNKSRFSNISGSSKIEVRPKTLEALSSMCAGILLSPKGKAAKQCISKLRDALDKKMDECDDIRFELDSDQGATKNTRLAQCEEEVSKLLSELDDSQCVADYNKEYDACYYDSYFDYLRNAPVRNIPIPTAPSRKIPVRIIP